MERYNRTPKKYYSYDKQTISKLSNNNKQLRPLPSYLKLQGSRQDRLKSKTNSLKVQIKTTPKNKSNLSPYVLLSSKENARPRFFSNPRARPTTTQRKSVAAVPSMQLLSHQKYFYPLSPQVALKRHYKILTERQRTELLGVQQIWYLGQNCAKKINSLDKDGFTKFASGQQVNFRFEILSQIGRGSFGQVYKAKDHKTQQMVALKIVKSKKKCTDQAMIQYKILKILRQKDPKDSQNTVKLKLFFVYRRHVCFVFQLLSHNLYQLQQLNKFRSLSDDIIRRITIQLLNSLVFLGKNGIVHCDLKPQNILLKNPGRTGIKVIDFGSSCLSNQIIHNYIQSRYYRAPEIMLGYPYGLQIDMWSLCTILAELHIGKPIFSGEDQTQQIFLIAQTIGKPDLRYIQRTQRGAWFFDQNDIKIYDRKGRIRKSGSRPLHKQLQGADPDFIDFIAKGLTWQPEARLKPLNALQHLWIQKGLPEQARAKKQVQMERQQKQFQQLTSKFYLKRY